MQTKINPLDLVAERQRVTQLVYLASVHKLGDDWLAEAVNAGTTRLQAVRDIQRPAPPPAPKVTGSIRYHAEKWRDVIRMRDRLDALADAVVWQAEWDTPCRLAILTKDDVEVTDADVKQIRCFGQIESVNTMTSGGASQIILEVKPNDADETEVSVISETPVMDDNLAWVIARQISGMADVAAGQFGTWDGRWDKQAGRIKLRRASGGMSNDEIVMLRRFGFIHDINAVDDRQDQTCIVADWYPTDESIRLVQEKSQL